jgi:predicted dehydrogenase
LAALEKIKMDHGIILNFGVLSTASVNEYAFLPVIKRIPGAKLVAVASRDAERARVYAKKNGILRSYGDYDSLLSDADIDCIYIPLPISMHAEWSVKAMEAGKHVLCEKPVAANEAEARAIAEKVKETGAIFAEAFHYRYHPLAECVEKLVRGGEIGEVTNVFAQFGIPLPDRGKVQFRPDLAGGALLDIGCYPVSFSRWIAVCDEAVVVKATAKMTSTGVDGSMRADLKFKNGITAKIGCSLIELMPMSAFIRGTKGSISILAPFTPAFYAGPVLVGVYAMILQQGIRIRNIRVTRALTYQRQLESFCDCVRSGSSPLTNADEAVVNMRLIDAIYNKAGVSRL